MKWNKLLNSKARLKAKICDNQGITLVEILITLSIMAIVSPLLYGAFNIGQRAYVKQSAEVQFREDADYVSTMIMNEFFSTELDYVQKCPEPNCLKIRDITSTSLEEVESEDSNTYYDVERESNMAATEITIQLKEVNGKGQIYVNNAPLETASDFTGSSLAVSCPAGEKPEGCPTGTVQLNMALSDPKTMQTLQLESEFGF